MNEKKKKEEQFIIFLSSQNAPDTFMVLINDEYDDDPHTMSSILGTIHECTSDYSVDSVHIAPIPGHRNGQRSFLSHRHRRSHQRVGQTR